MIMTTEYLTPPLPFDREIKVGDVFWRCVLAGDDWATRRVTKVDGEDGDIIWFSSPSSYKGEWALLHGWVPASYAYQAPPIDPRVTYVDELPAEEGDVLLDPTESRKTVKAPGPFSLSGRKGLFSRTTKFPPKLTDRDAPDERRIAEHWRDGLKRMAEHEIFRKASEASSRRAMALTLDYLDRCIGAEDACLDEPKEYGPQDRLPPIPSIEPENLDPMPGPEGEAWVAWCEQEFDARSRAAIAALQRTLREFPRCPKHDVALAPRHNFEGTGEWVCGECEE